MSKLAMRKFYSRPSLDGFLDGLEKGLSISDNVFSAHKVRVRVNPSEGFQQDVEAMRRDVKRAREKLTKSFGINEFSFRPS